MPIGDFGTGSGNTSGSSNSLGIVDLIKLEMVEWKGYDGSPNSSQSINFTPYNKPAANVLAKWFGRLGKEVENPVRK